MKTPLRTIARYFFSGMIFIVPLVATGYFVFLSFSWLDGLLNLPYPGLGFVIIFGAITLFGYLTSNFAVRAATDWFDHVMNKIPLIKLIYSSIKDLIGAFVGEAFDGIVNDIMREAMVAFAENWLTRRKAK